MKTDFQEYENCILIRFSGKLVGSPDAAKFYEKLKESIEKGHRNFVVDMESVPWISSSGLGMLVSGLTSIKRVEGEMKLTRISDKTRSLFALAQLDKIFEHYDSIESAITDFKN